MTETGGTSVTDYGVAARDQVRILARLRASLAAGGRVLLGVPLHFKIMGMVLGFILIFGAVTIFTISGILVRNMESVLESEGRSFAVELANQVPEYLLIHDLYGLTRMLANTVQNRPDLRYAVVFDRLGQVVAHTFGAGFPADLLKAGAGESEAALAGMPRLRKIRTNEGMIWETTAPIMQGEEGYIRIGVREDGFRRQIAFFLRSFLVSSIWVVVLGTLLSAYLTWLITRPLKRLVLAARAVEGGDYRVSLPEGGRDETGRLIEAFNVMVRQLARAEETRLEKEKIRREFLQRVIASQEGERQRIARELHDQTGQALASIMVGLKVLENAAASDQVRARVADLKKAITAEMNAIHDLTVALRPSILDDMGLVPALEMLVSELRKRYGLAASLTVIGFAGRRADGYSETCIYRMVQEALTNVVRHAEAAEVKVLLDWRGDKIRGVVEDDGVGFDPASLAGSDRLGIYGMKERAQLLGGSCRIESESGQGTMVVFEVPAH